MLGPDCKFFITRSLLYSYLPLLPYHLLSPRIIYSHPYTKHHRDNRHSNRLHHSTDLLCCCGVRRPWNCARKRILKIIKKEVIDWLLSFCRKCRFNVPDKSFHCPYCDVCIEGYDHHCPWTSKCIGKKNLIQFYVFLISTPVFIVYCAFAFGFTMELADRPHLRKVG